MQSSTDLQRNQSIGEEIANAISHGLGVLGAVIAIPVLVAGAVREGGVAEVIGASIFGLTMLLLYLASTIYHALPHGKTKRIFQIIDHCAIFLLIAGTYTPFTLGILRGSWGWTLFGIVWGLAVFGIILKTLVGTRFQRLSTCLYLAMGWIIVIALKPMLEVVPLNGILWLVAGGVAYTLGVAFFRLDHRVRYAHFIWHLFVVAGSSCHFVAVFAYST